LISTADKQKLPATDQTKLNKWIRMYSSGDKTSGHGVERLGTIGVGGKYKRHFVVRHYIGFVDAPTHGTRQGPRLAGVNTTRFRAWLKSMQPGHPPMRRQQGIPRRRRTGAPPTVAAAAQERKKRTKAKSTKQKTTFKKKKRGVTKPKATRRPPSSSSSKGQKKKRKKTTKNSSSASTTWNSFKHDLARYHRSF
jgi:hypothetical protein